MAKRTMKRCRSGADAPCPECGKKLRGLKGLNAHREQTHGVRVAVVAPKVARR